MWIFDGGGSLRYAVKDDGEIAPDTPAIVYPENSYFGEVLSTAERPFGSPGFSNNPVCETAFSSGIKELVLKGIGIGWLPISMIYREIERGELISLANSIGTEKLKVTIYADANDEMTVSLLDVWCTKRN